ncbi:unnamed protein product [Pleuronectes platessa]|uniref:Uncharacterized protein n=1 Tax=Pleuronectes platessa TaxID=8262 RepID=A0A9N7V8S2_PLEPL|nr:unnamed protein product [Pleuronectes platessa]
MAENPSGSRNHLEGDVEPASPRSRLPSSFQRGRNSRGAQRSDTAVAKEKEDERFLLVVSQRIDGDAENRRGVKLRKRRRRPDDEGLVAVTSLTPSLPPSLPHPPLLLLSLTLLSSFSFSPSLSPSHESYTDERECCMVEAYGVIFSDAAPPPPTPPPPPPSECLPSDSGSGGGIAMINIALLVSQQVLEGMVGARRSGDEIKRSDSDINTHHQPPHSPNKLDQLLTAAQMKDAVVSLHFRTRSYTTWIQISIGALTVLCILV